MEKKPHMGHEYERNKCKENIPAEICNVKWLIKNIGLKEICNWISRFRKTQASTDSKRGEGNTKTKN